MNQQELYDDLAAVIRHAAETLKKDEIRLLCFGCGVDASEVYPPEPIEDLFGNGPF